MTTMKSDWFLDDDFWGTTDYTFDDLESMTLHIIIILCRNYVMVQDLFLNKEKDDFFEYQKQIDIGQYTGKIL